MLDALAKSRRLTRTSTITTLIVDAFGRLPVRERKTIEQAWSQENAPSGSRLVKDTFVDGEGNEFVRYVREDDPSLKDLLAGFSDEEDDAPVYPAHGDDR
jgi:hypothetical protein